MPSLTETEPSVVAAPPVVPRRAAEAAAETG